MTIAWSLTLREVRGAQRKRSAASDRIKSNLPMTISKVHAENFLALLLCLMIAACAATLPELKGPVAPREKLVTLATRPGVTVRVLLITPDTIAKGYSCISRVATALW